ncbi:AI-2E family transporter YdiK [Pandoraea pulmonicola]|uniref:Inner membrane protein n=1 Tax=Pandoraea pulmonicola TaxID=93221 RepID=A0AAJ4ZHJ2_PANPU|nr:AI-2E family transporter YdiK [Pandoraea pulmonicola]SUA93361.1 putative inner membrane protein [Pandoraea pulmonicola]
MISTTPSELARNLLIILVLSLLMIGTLWVLLPFLPALIWAVTIVASTWPLLIGLERRLWGRRWLATTIMIVGMLIIVVAPLSAAIGTLIGHASDISEQVHSIGQRGLPTAPDWLARIPVIGQRASDEWQALAAAGPGGLVAKVQPYAVKAASWGFSKLGSIGLLFVHLGLTLIISAILFMQGDRAARALIRTARRLGGDRGEESVRLAGMSIRAVALGIVVTAVTQSLLGGLGLWLTGVPLPGFLTALMLVLCIAQIGPFPVLLSSVGWLYWQDSPTLATLLLVLSVFIGMLDNVMRPMLIRRGADLPMTLILAGVLGGMLTFGIVGLFVGPVILAVTYTLLMAWINDGLNRPTLAPTGAPAVSPEPSVAPVTPNNSAPAAEASTPAQPAAKTMDAHDDTRA